jgi:hypothetical protein
MQKITAKLIAKRTTSSAQVTGNLNPAGVSSEGTNQLVSQFVQIIMNTVVEVGGTGKIGFLYEPGIGITIDVREYDVSKLPRTRQKRLSKQVRAIEDSPVRTQNDGLLPIVIKIDMNVVE